MRRTSRRSREVDLFNFSFLDILACVIGLLIFILSIVVVSGGGSRSRQTAGRLANAEHQLQRAQEAAQRQAERRRTAELTLKEQSRDFADPKAAATALRADIGLLEDETAHLDAAILSAQNKTESLSRALQAMGQTPVIDPAASAIQDELRRLDEETADLRNRTADERRKSQANVREVQYYVPHLREVNRATVWVEISAGRMYCLNSNDYRVVPLNEESNTFIRWPGAKGTLVSDMVTGKADIPFALSSALPDFTVLVVALHPDGYEAFRALRKWAWARGFSVNWAPQDDSPITLTHTTHVLEQ